MFYIIVDLMAQDFKQTKCILKMVAFPLDCLESRNKNNFYSTRDKKNGYYYCACCTILHVQSWNVVLFDHQKERPSYDQLYSGILFANES